VSSIKKRGRREKNKVSQLRFNQKNPRRKKYPREGDRDVEGV